MIQQAFAFLSETNEEFYGQECKVLEKPPTPLQFYHDYVSQNKPVIIRNAINHWPALKRWGSNDYLRRMMKDTQIHCAVTPNGRADAITFASSTPLQRVEEEGEVKLYYEHLQDISGKEPSEVQEVFAEPEERRMSFSEVVDILESQASTSASTTAEQQDCYYIQHQNGNFEAEFHPLWRDVDMDIPFATAAFKGLAPDVVNLWLGSGRSTSSIHKDPYENLYAVVSGEKHFYLYPPNTYPFLYEQEYKLGKYVYNEELKKWTIEVLEASPMHKWSSIDPERQGDPEYVKQYPLLKHAKLMKVVVKAGEVLYLPSLWFHQVAQQNDEEGKIIAVNYWYDMQFGPLYSYYQFVEKLARLEREQQTNKKNQQQ